MLRIKNQITVSFYYFLKEAADGGLLCHFTFFPGRIGVFFSWKAPLNSGSLLCVFWESNSRAISIALFIRRVVINDKDFGVPLFPEVSVA